MAKQWYEKEEFIELRDEWYAKLQKETGFFDIEVIDEITHQPCGMLRGMSQGDLRRGLYKEENVEYYRFARQIVHDLPMGWQRQAWRLHSEGYSIERIWNHMEGRYEGITKSSVRKWIRLRSKQLLQDLREGKYA